MLNKTFKTPTQFDRNMKICQLRLEKDMTIYQLADNFGITPQRVQQILERDLEKYIKSQKSGAIDRYLLTLLYLNYIRKGRKTN